MNLLALLVNAVAIRVELVVRRLAFVAKLPNNHNILQFYYDSFQTLFVDLAWKQLLFLKILYFWRRLKHYCSKFSAVLWRALEVHMIKVVIFTVFSCCIAEVSDVFILVAFLIFDGKAKAVP